MSAGLAPGEIIIAMGSPGTTRRRTNTTIATPASVTSATRRRRRTASAIIASSRLHPIAPKATGAGRDRRPPAQAAGDTSVGCKAPDLFGMTLRSDL